MQICFFQDALVSCLKPLTLTRPADDLRVGIYKIHEKWCRRLSIDTFSRIVPPRMEGVFNCPDLSEEVDCIWINGRYLPENGIEEHISELGVDEGLMFQNVPVVVKFTGRRSSGLFKAGNINTSDVSFNETKLGGLLSQPWQVFARNEAEILSDASISEPFKPVIPGDYSGVHFVNPKQVFVGGDTRIEPGVVINASDGPVYLDEGAHIMSGSMIRGPVVIGRDAVVKMGAKIYGATTIGPHCKVGGELNNVVFQAYSNKAHDGFLGNSVVGEWCNFGADTNNSNLKNNYSTVRLTDWDSGREYDTELQFCGLIMGDHSKTAINTVFNTGTVCGVSCNIFSGKFPAKYIRSFRWLGPAGEDIYKFDKAMEAAERMMKRRGIVLTPEYRAMMRHLYEKSKV